jgi:hypothetical protein
VRQRRKRRRTRSSSLSFGARSPALRHTPDCKSCSGALSSATAPASFRATSACPRARLPRALLQACASSCAHGPGARAPACLQPLRTLVLAPSLVAHAALLPTVPPGRAPRPVRRRSPRPPAGRASRLLAAAPPSCHGHPCGSASSRAPSCHTRLPRRHQGPGLPAWLAAALGRASAATPVYSPARCARGSALRAPASAPATAGPQLPKIPRSPPRLSGRASCVPSRRAPPATSGQPRPDAASQHVAPSR